MPGLIHTGCCRGVVFGIFLFTVAMFGLNCNSIHPQSIRSAKDKSFERKFQRTLDVSKYGVKFWSALRYPRDMHCVRLSLRGGSYNQNFDDLPSRQSDGSSQRLLLQKMQHSAQRAALRTEVSSSDPDMPERTPQQAQLIRGAGGVQGTNDDSTMSKWSTAQAGYFQDEFLRYFALVQSPRRRRAPLIHRGYAARVLAVRAAVRSFVSAAATGAQTPTAQVVNLGCGFDTTYLQLKMEARPSKHIRPARPAAAHNGRRLCRRALPRPETEPSSPAPEKTGRGSRSRPAGRAAGAADLPDGRGAGGGRVTLMRHCGAAAIMRRGGAAATTLLHCAAMRCVAHRVMLRRAHQPTHVPEQHQTRAC